MASKRRSNGGRRATKSNKTKKIITPVPQLASTPPAVGNQNPSALFSRDQTNENENTPITKNKEVSTDFDMEDQNDTVKSSEKPPEHNSRYKSTDNGTNEKSSILSNNATAFTLTDHNETMKSSEKPPEQHPTYKSALLSDSPPFSNPLNVSTFLLHKKHHDGQSPQTINLSDDITVGQENRLTTSKYHNSIRMTMMFKIPSKKEGCSDENAPKLAIQKMNMMIKTLSNKLPCKVGPWILNQSITVIKESDLCKFLPEDDIDFVESYVFGYSRLLAPGKNGYVRLRIFYTDLTSLAEIKGVIAQFKLPRERFLQISHSNATSPVTIGTLTGSVGAMADSADFLQVMKTKFSLQDLGLWFTQPRTSRSGAFNKASFTVHIEINRTDLAKRDEMERYFNHSPSTTDHNFFGTPLLLAKAYDFYADDDTKAQIDKHNRKQTSLGSSLRSTIVTGVQLCNWANSERTSTLHRDLMEVESIVNKQVIKGKTTSSFKGRVFYAVIPDKKSFIFYYTKANYSEGRSIARGLPLFIRDHFRLDPSFFCSSEALTTALAGDWNYNSRSFLSAEEKVENDKLDLMEAEACAENEQFISKDQQIVMALPDDEFSVETRVTKGDAAPLPAHNDDVSDMTGSTRESKAKAYADKAVKVVAAQYSSTISNMQGDIGAKDEKIAQLELLLEQMKNSTDATQMSDSKASSSDHQAKNEHVIDIEAESSSMTKKRKTAAESSLEGDMSL